MFTTCHQTSLSLNPPIDYACARVALMEAQPPQERPPYHQPAEQPPESLPYHQQGEQHGFLDSYPTDYTDVQYKHNHHHHHNRHIQQQAIQHHHPYQFPVSGGCYIAVEASPLSFGIPSHVETEKQVPPQNQYADQCGSASVQVSHKPCEDVNISAKQFEDTHLLSKVREAAYGLPGRLENLHFVYDGRYPQHRFQSSASSTLALAVPRIKLLCSIDGRIMGRPADGKLRYCGGDTRLITVDRGICFVELMDKLSQMYSSALTLKYQLPGEDLDALVSVSSDDDLQNMLEEYDKMVAMGGNSWFRLFIFRIPSDSEIFSVINFCNDGGHCYSEIMQRYINAINGFDSRGASEHPTDVQLEKQFNDHYLPFRKVPDAPFTTLVGPCVTTKSRVPSAPSSVPSSPSVAAIQARHKQCGTGDVCFQISKDQHCFATPRSGPEVNTQEFSQDRHVDSLKCDHHQGYILGESPGMQQDLPFSRADAPWVKERGTHYTDLEDSGVHQLEWHRGTGTVVVDAVHDVPKRFGLIDSRHEAYCGIPLAGQPLTSLAYHGGQVEDAFGRAEPVQHCFVEGHKQVPLLHQLHQTGSQLHWEGLIRSQRGPAIESTFANVGGQGHSPLSQEPAHNHFHTNVKSSIPIKAMSSAPSSPRNGYHGGCCCCRQNFQVDRGISVSLGEHSYSKRPSHFGDPSLRMHGLPLLSRFCDESNSCSDSATWHCLPNLKKGLEFDEAEHEAGLGKHRLGRIKTRRQPVECGANEGAAHSSMEPVKGLGEGSLHHCRFFCADIRDAKGLHIDKARVFPTPESQAYMGECDVHSGTIEENMNVSVTGRMTHDQIAVLNLERGANRVLGMSFRNGQVDMETSMQDASGYGHAHASSPSSVLLGHGEPGFDLKMESFSSTDAVAGSLSRPPSEPPVWVVSSPVALHNDESKEREAQGIAPPVELMPSTRQLADGTMNYENMGDPCKSPSFGRMDSYRRVMSTSTTVDASELRVENSPVSSLIYVPEEKTSISYANGSQPKFDHFCSVSSSEPFPSRTLESSSFKESGTLALPIYDKSPICSVNDATFSFAQREEKSVSSGKEVPELCENSRSIHIATPYQSNGQHLQIAKDEIDHTAPHGQETTPVPEDLRSLSQPSSRQCSVELGAHDKGNAPSDVVSVAESNVTNEVNMSGSINICTQEDEKELPATQAEAEAVARGLQIIKNDDLEDLKELGSGTYGTVFHGKWRGSDVAIKRIKASCFTSRPSEQERLISDFWREAGTLSQLHHPNIVAFYGVVPDGPGGTLATVTEYMVNGSLKQVLVKKDRTIDRRKRLLIAMDAAFGMEYLHSKRIVHFDLKSENLLVNMRDAHRPICKVGDFGLSKVKHQTLVSGGVRGTLPWMAPELLSTKGLVTEKVDVYSFGIVMWELLTGEEPYAKMHCGTIIGGIVNDNLRPVIPSWCDPSWRDLMERCWSGNPADRPSFSAVASELRTIASSMNVK